jgi:hypothetical protein
MKRVLLAALSVALLVGTASAQSNNADLWIQAPDGSDTLNIAVSETGVIQLWMDYYGSDMDCVMVGMDAILEHRITNGQDFEVTGFIDHGPWGIGDTFYRKSRGILDEAPHDGVPDITGPGNLSWYQFQGDVAPPYECPIDRGLLPGGGAILLDEIIIEGTTSTDTATNRVVFGSGTQEPSWYELCEYGCDVLEYSFNLGTGINKKNALFVHVDVPEPGSLALLAFGGLALIRRR